MPQPASQPRTVAVCIDTRDGAGRKRLYGVAQYARRHGWRMMLVRRSGPEAADEVSRLHPQGIIAYTADRWLIDLARRRKVPLADTAQGEIDVPLCATLDGDAVGRLAAEHLAGLGLRHFGYCGVTGRRASAERRAAMAAHLAARGCSLSTFSQSIAEGESRLDPLIRWLRTLPKPAGILAFDDKLGERVLTACRWDGLAVPEQVAVLGIGDDDLMCEVSSPSLSSIRFPTARLGYEAAEMLDQAMDNRPPREPFRKIQPTEIAVRASTDMLAVDDALIRSAVALIRKRAGETIGVKHVAAALGVSRRTLDRHFMDALGRTVHDELDAVRMQTCAEAACGCARCVAEIASACG